MSAPNNIEQRLKFGARELDLQLDDTCISRLVDYLGLVVKWNKAFNLTAIRNPEDMLSLHLLDSLAIAPHIKATTGKRLIDVGTGAGLPGVVIAIIYPQIQVTLLDANGKKCRFLNQVKIQLGLKNIQVIQHRVESYQPEIGFDLVVSRAFATLKDMTDNADHLLCESGRFLAMKGRYPKRELEELGAKFRFNKAQRLQIPGLDVERYLIDIDIDPEHS